jgi:hypothetical protein
MDDNREFERNESFAAIFTQATRALARVYDRDARILLFNTPASARRLPPRGATTVGACA